MLPVVRRVCQGVTVGVMVAGGVLAQAGWLGPAPGTGSESGSTVASATALIPLPTPRRAGSVAPDPFYTRPPTAEELELLRFPLSMSLKEQPLEKVLELIRHLVKVDVEVPEEVRAKMLSMSCRGPLAQGLEVLACASGTEIRLEGRTLKVRRGWTPRPRPAADQEAGIPLSMQIHAQPVFKVFELITAMTKKAACVEPTVGLLKIDLAVERKTAAELLAMLAARTRLDGFVDGPFLRLQRPRRPGDVEDPLAWARGTGLLE